MRKSSESKSFSPPSSGSLTCLQRKDIKNLADENIEFAFVDEFSNKHLPSYITSSNFIPKERKVQSAKQIFKFADNVLEAKSIPPFQPQGASSKQLSTFDNIQNKRKKSQFKDTTQNNPPVQLDSSTFQYGKPGWNCSSCGNFNYKMRKKCNRCAKIRLLTEDYFKKSVEVMRFEPEVRANDWYCAKCKQLNFAHRKACYFCSRERMFD